MGLWETRESMEPEELARAIQELNAWAARHAPRPEPELRRRLREHLDADPADLEVVAANLSPYDHVNAQVALDAYLAEPGISCAHQGCRRNEDQTRMKSSAAEASSAMMVLVSSSRLTRSAYS